MSEVFRIDEASMHAWKNLGFSPGVKAYFEQAYGSDAYEVAVGFIPMLIALRDGYNQPGIFGDPQAIVDYAEGDDSRWSAFVVRSVRNNPKLKQALRNAAPSVLKMGAERGYVKIQELIDASPARAPEKYGAARVILDLGGGWRWVEVPEDECRDWEGHLMQHCGDPMGRMLSLRDPQGKPHVSLDYADEERGPAEIVQIRGKQDTYPKPKYFPMIRALWNHLGRPKIERDADEELLGYLGLLAGPQSPEDLARARRVMGMDPEPQD